MFDKLCTQLWPSLPQCSAVFWFLLHLDRTCLVIKWHVCLISLCKKAWHFINNHVTSGFLTVCCVHWNSGIYVCLQSNTFIFQRDKSLFKQSSYPFLETYMSYLSIASSSGKLCSDLQTNILIYKHTFQFACLQQGCWQSIRPCCHYTFLLPDSL